MCIEGKVMFWVNLVIGLLETYWCCVGTKSNSSSRPLCVVRLCHYSVGTLLMWSGWYSPAMMLMLLHVCNLVIIMKHLNMLVGLHLTVFKLCYLKHWMCKRWCRSSLLSFVLELDGCFDGTKCYLLKCCWCLLDCVCIAWIIWSL